MACLHLSIGLANIGPYGYTVEKAGSKCSPSKRCENSIGR